MLSNFLEFMGTFWSLWLFGYQNYEVLKGDMPSSELTWNYHKNPDGFVLLILLQKKKTRECFFFKSYYVLYVSGNFEILQLRAKFQTAVVSCDHRCYVSLCNTCHTLQYLTYFVKRSITLCNTWRTL